MVWGGATLAAFALFLARNAYVLSARMNADGDFAANGFLIDRAIKFHLLVGNYSRVGFHHPGPAFMYVQGWSEWLFFRVLGIVPTAYNAHLLGILLLNAVLVGAVAQIVHAHQRSLLVTAAGLAGALLFIAGQQFLITSTWMPNVYFAPFLLFTAAVASVLAGRWASLPWTAFAAGLLVHGHVSFLSFVGPTAVVPAVVLWRQNRGHVRAAVSEHRRPVLLGLAILALFALPIVVNTLLHWPGEFGHYLDYVRNGQAGHHSVGAVVRYALDFWFKGPGRVPAAGAMILAALALAAREPDPEPRRFGLALLASCGLMELWFLNYGLRGIDNLSERYIGLFTIAVPALVIAVIAMSATRQLLAVRGRIGRVPVARVAVAGALAVAVVSAASAKGLANTYRGYRQAPALYGALAADPDRAGRPVALLLPNESWPQMAGVVYYAEHHRLRVCAIDPVFALLVTARYVCSADEASRGWRVTMTPDEAAHPPGPPVYADDQVYVAEVVGS
jgi:hypothetical protein